MSVTFALCNVLCCRFWVTEKRVYQERLIEEQKAAQDLSTLEAQIADKDAEINAAKERLIALKAQMLRGDETVTKLLNMVMSGSK